MTFSDTTLYFVSWLLQMSHLLRRRQSSVCTVSTDLCAPSPHAFARLLSTITNIAFQARVRRKWRWHREERERQRERDRGRVVCMWVCVGHSLQLLNIGKLSSLNSLPFLSLQFLSPCVSCSLLVCLTQCLQSFFLVRFWETCTIVLSSWATHGHIFLKPRWTSACNVPYCSMLCWKLMHTFSYILYRFSTNELMPIPVV